MEKSNLESIVKQNDSLVRYGKLNFYLRPKDSFLGKLKVVYYYTKEESIVRNISYVWNCPKNCKSEDYSNQFDKLVNYISREIKLSVGDQG